MINNPFPIDADNIDKAMVADMAAGTPWTSTMACTSAAT
jgi:hypothetical protein